MWGDEGGGSWPLRRLAQGQSYGARVGQGLVHFHRALIGKTRVTFVRILLWVPSLRKSMLFSRRFSSSAASQLPLPLLPESKPFGLFLIRASPPLQLWGSSPSGLLNYQLEVLTSPNISSHPWVASLLPGGYQHYKTLGEVDGFSRGKTLMIQGGL